MLNRRPAKMSEYGNGSVRDTTNNDNGETNGERDSHDAVVVENKCVKRGTVATMKIR